MKHVRDFDPLTGERSLESLNNASLEENIVLENEHKLAKALALKKSDEAMKKSKEQKIRESKITQAKEIQKQREEYNKNVLLYDYLASQAEKVSREQNELSLEKAVAQYINQPWDLETVKDDGFKPTGTASSRPLTDFDKIVSGLPFGGESVVIPEKSSRVSQEVYEIELEKTLRKNGDLFMVNGSDEIVHSNYNSDSMGSLLPSIEDAKDVNWTRIMEDWLRNEIGLNQPVNPPTSSAPPPPPQYIQMPSAGIDKKTLVIAGAALVGVTVLALVLRRK